MNALMTIDSKRTGLTPRIQTNTRAVAVEVPAPLSSDAAAPAPSAPPSSSGYRATDGFETSRGQRESVGRRGANGSSDDSIGRGDLVLEGRKPKTGSSDDSIGRGSSDDSIGRGSSDDSIGRKSGTGSSDDSIGRKSGTGSSDDSIGRKSGTGSSDDSIGVAAALEALRDSLVGPDTDANRVARRDALFKQLENPTATAKIPLGNVRARPLLEAQLERFASEQLPGVQQQLIRLTHALDEQGLRLMGALTERSPQLLIEKDSRGGTLLSNLTKLAVGSLSPMLAGDVKLSELLNSTLRDIVNPNRVEQGNAPTCTVTSVQFELVADSPSEYARLMCELATTGSAKMRGGEMLKLEAGDGVLKARDGRSITDSLFQTAAMEFANGVADFNPLVGASTDASTGVVRRGIIPEQQARLLEQLFGVKYVTTDLADVAAGEKMLESLRGFDSTRHPNRPVILHIDQGAINHAVNLERIAQGRVVFRDPYGVLRSMPESLFAQFVVAVQQPEK